MTLFQIEVISDLASAWCYIGKKRLDQAIALHRRTYPGGRNDTFQITWRPYYSDRNTTTTTSDADRTKTTRMRQVGESVGINFAQTKQLESTRNAHRLISLTQTRYSSETLDTLVNSMFAAYHELELDVSSKDTLRQLAIDAGVTATDVDALFNTDKDVKAIDAEAQLNREILNGADVPHFTIQNHRLDGAQDIWNFMVIFGNIKKKEEELDNEEDEDDEDE